LPPLPPAADPAPVLSPAGLNHVVRKWSDAVDPTANLLVAVPGGADGPGGVLVCAENFIVYKNHGHADKRCPLPRRKDLPPEQGLLLVASAVHRQRDLFFIVVQSEAGDLYKVTVQTDGEDKDAVSEVKVRYLDSVPTCVALCILRSGFLFCASEFGNSGFYQFQGVGEDDESPSCSSLTFEGGDEAAAAAARAPRGAARLFTPPAVNRPSSSSSRARCATCCTSTTSTRSAR